MYNNLDHMLYFILYRFIKINFTYFFIPKIKSHMTRIKIWNLLNIIRLYWEISLSLLIIDILRSNIIGLILEVKLTGIICSIVSFELVETFIESPNQICTSV